MENSNLLKRNMERNNKTAARNKADTKRNIASIHIERTNTKSNRNMNDLDDNQLKQFLIIYL